MDTSSSITSLVQKLNTLGEAVAKPVGSTANKVEPQEKFVTVCQADIVGLKAGEPFGKMFTMRKGGGFVVTLKNGIKTIELVPGRPNYRLPNTDAAMEFLQIAIDACEAGELDEIFAKQAERKLAD